MGYGHLKYKIIQAGLYGASPAEKSLRGVVEGETGNDVRTAGERECWEVGVTWGL